jgi:hypothetical protein
MVSKESKAVDVFAVPLEPVISTPDNDDDDDGDG